jgi:NADH-quinone oxidoreductase subunit M
VNDFPWLTLLWALPAVGSVAVLVLPASQRTLARCLAFGISVAVLAIGIVLAVRFEPGGAQYQFVESREWIPAFGAGYTVGLDGIALVLVLLTAALIPLLILAGWNDER